VNATPPRTYRRLAAALALALVLLTAFGAATTGGAPAPLAKRAAVRGDQSRLQGVWLQKTIIYEGNDLSKANAPHQLQWQVTADRITIYAKGKQNCGYWTYRIDPHVSPAALDLTVSDGKTTFQCSYKIEGDRLTVLLQNFPDRNGRPRDFTAGRAQPGVGYHVFERVKSGQLE
jgi:uncharacterized protein (TIGR03067 family)